MFMQIQWLSSFMIIVATIEHAITQDRKREVQHSSTCGGHLVGPNGVIQTPNFPEPFPVPIKCRWVIENTNVNGTISIYFTQQYTTSGLTFTEYLYYDSTFKAGERVALTVTEENITKIKWLQVTSPILVVELSLPRLEGTQLRALGLLSVFGFNMTYAVGTPAAASDTLSCSAVECRLLGHCYANYNFQQFYCSCFDGFSGLDCGEGPLCTNLSNTCLNGGICRQMGPAAVSCVCVEGYSGDLCETRLALPECGLEECSESCEGNAFCDCNARDNDLSSARFDIHFKIKSQNNVSISQEIIYEITNYLKSSNITLKDNIEIINRSRPDANNEWHVWLRVWAARREASELRAVLARSSVVNVGVRGWSILSEPLHVDMFPALTLESLSINQRPVIWEGSEFILSCMAYGSPNIEFTWYKDGVKINFNAVTRDIWVHTIAEDALGRRMSVLAVSAAGSIDGGRWACAASDAGRRRCRALTISVLSAPEVSLMPTTLTVDKGENVSITCLASASGSVHGALGFSWARDKTLLPLSPGRVVWEDLYPAGSVLKLYDIQKSGEYSCQVSSVAGTTSGSVSLWVVRADGMSCSANPSHGISWPRTAPGAYAMATCPNGYFGSTKRFCEPMSGHHDVKWQPPDFSACLPDTLRDIYSQFIRITYGYSWKKVSAVAREYNAALSSLPTHPGGSTYPLQHATSMASYLISSAATEEDRVGSVHYLFNIFDKILNNPEAFTDEENVYNFQNSLSNFAELSNNIDVQLHGFTVIAKKLHSRSGTHFKFQTSDSDEWLLTSASVEMYGDKDNVTVVAINYHNLAAKLPSLRRVTEIIENQVIEFLLWSSQTQISANSVGSDSNLQNTITLIYTNLKNRSADLSLFRCGLRTGLDPRMWTTTPCDVRVISSDRVACHCIGFGTYALFGVAKQYSSTETETELNGILKITVGIGGALCAVAAVLQLLALAGGHRPRLPALLKSATAGAHASATAALLACAVPRSSSQQDACPGTLGWVCAACWCVGGAALCAQPLLLQAELAGRSNHVASVALLAGVCTLAWLIAKLWGGAPLQLGAPAQAVCMATSILMTIMTLMLVLSAFLRMRTIGHKVPAEKRIVLREREKSLRNTVMLVLSTATMQVAGVAYAQASDKRDAIVLAVSAAALSNGVAMVICYVLQDAECLRQARRALSLRPAHTHSPWRDSPAGDISLSLYIQQPGEVESKEAVDVIDGQSRVAAPSYWSPPDLDSPARGYRLKMTLDNTADIVQCSQYRDITLNTYRHKPRHSLPTRVVCDLISHSPISESLEIRPQIQNAACSTDFAPLNEKHTISNENCILCSISNPDVSNISSTPIKSCLKKLPMKSELASSTSLPSIKYKTKGESKPNSNIDQVNKQWSKVYDSPVSDKVLNKISNDLNFLLNRTQEASNSVISK